MSSAIVDRIREEFSSEIARLYRRKKRGYLSDDEFKTMIGHHQALLSGTERLDYYCGSDLDSQQWIRLQADHAAWLSGLPLESTIGKEWLKQKTTSCPRPVAELKKEFFDIRDALCLGIEEFEPVPSNIEKSAIGIPLYPNSSRAMEFPSNELSQLFDGSENTIVGNSRTFALENGIELHISMESLKAEESFVTLIASGYISEYMLPQNRSLEIMKKREKNSTPIVFFSYQSDEDLQYFYNNPRFKPYLEFIYDREARSRDEGYKRVIGLINTIK